MTTAGVSGCPRSGQRENSPAIHCWDPMRFHPQSVKRTADPQGGPLRLLHAYSEVRHALLSISEEVSAIVFDSVSLE